MKEPSQTKVLHICMLAHESINKLSVIIGNCDLAKEKITTDPDSAKRFAIIRQAANAMATELNKHQCGLSELMRSVPAEKWGILVGARKLRRSTTRARNEFSERQGSR